MAYQPKSYRKFVATAATATLVAGAIAPLASAAVTNVKDFTDVAPQYKDAVQFLLDKEATQGKTDTQFGVADNITRQDAAAQLVKVLGLEVDDTIKTTKFTDVPERTAKYVDALVKAGITQGKTETTFGATEEITRGQLAIWIAKGFKLEGKSDVKFTDVAEQYKSAVSALVENKVTSGKSETQFGTAEQATRGQFAIFLYKADLAIHPIAVVDAVKAENGKVTVTLDKEVEAVKAEDFKLTQAIDGKDATEVVATEAKLAEDKKTVELTIPAIEAAEKEQSVVITAAYKSGEAKAAEAFKVASTEVAVEGVSAIGAKQIEVKFTAPVDSKTTFEVKKGSSKVNTEKVTLSADNKTAVIEMAGKMTEGTYTVNATSGEKTLTGSVTVTNEKVDSVEILSENAVLNADSTAVTVGYQVKNQYGEDITKTTSIIANAAGAVVKGQASPTQSKGIVTINVDSEKAKEGDAITLTLVHGETGKSATKMLKVSAKSQVADVTLGSLYNKDGKTLSETTDLKKDKFYVLVDAVDQYGKALTASDLHTSGTNQNVVLNQTNPLVTKVSTEFTTVTVKGEEKVALALDSTSSLVVGENTVMAIATSTGNHSTLKITVAEGQRADSAVINTPDLVVAGEKTFVPVEVTDKEGNVITDVKILKDTKRGVTLSGSVKTDDWTTKDGKTGVYLDLQDETASSYKSIVAISATNKTAIQNIQVKEAAKPVRVDGVSSDVKTTLLAKDNATTTISLAGTKVIDQYERELTTEQKTKLFTDGDYKLVFAEEKPAVVEEKPATDKGVIQVTDKGVVTLEAKKDDKYVIGTEKVTVSIEKADGTKVSGSEKTITFRVTDGTEYVSYEVEKIGNILDEVGAGLVDDNDTTKAYTKDVVVYGVLDNGSKIKLDAGTDYSVDAPKWLQPTEGTLNPSNVPYATDAKEVKTTVTVAINATGDKFAEEVTVSKVKPTITSLKVVSEDTVDADTVYTADEKADFEDLKEVTGANFTSSTVAKNVDFAVVDSYGVMRVLNNAELATAAVDNLAYLPSIKLLVQPNTANSITITHNNSAAATIDGFKDTDFVNVTASVDGLEKSFKINGDKVSQGTVQEKEAAIVTANEELAKLTLSVANSILDDAALDTAKAQYDAAKAKVDAAIAKGAKAIDFSADFAKLEAQKTEIDRYEAVAAKLKADFEAAFLNQPTEGVNNGDPFNFDSDLTHFGLTPSIEVKDGKVTLKITGEVSADEVILGDGSLPTSPDTWGNLWVENGENKLAFAFYEKTAENTYKVYAKNVATVELDPANDTVTDLKPVALENQKVDMKSDILGDFTLDISEITFDATPAK
ncbi:S-layer homology domain-containing protein [Bacillus massiliigorillae]|uniref:S-layer homology domain-containing protein n=1 Tax=Bacillus massiliigorillae TaxID=1243664 RepID=UPI0003A280A9|nr:S-layer homology domain-containing protein [Bacillus massiliigorillae]